MIQKILCIFALTALSAVALANTNDIHSSWKLEQPDPWHLLPATCSVQSCSPYHPEKFCSTDCSGYQVQGGMAGDTDFQMIVTSPIEQITSCRGSIAGIKAQLTCQFLAGGQQFDSSYQQTA